MADRRTCVVYHDTYGERGFTALRQTWSRYRLFLDMLQKSRLPSRIPIVEPPPATENDILAVHTPAYVDFVQMLSLTGQGGLDGSTPAWRGMYARAERVVGGSLLAADMLASGRALHVFNPAGGQHHAHRDRGGGFCVFNDVVAAVRRLQLHGFRRIAVLDIDGHHGDGTESLLYQEPILFISTHQFGDRTYPGTGGPRDSGVGAGTGYTMNVPLSAGLGDDAYLQILEGTVEPLLTRYAPDVLVIQFGTDGHAADPLLKLRLSTVAYADIACWLHSLAHSLCGGRLLVVGGGGYEPHHVVRCWLLMLAGLEGMDTRSVHPEARLWLDEPVPRPDPEARSLTLAATQEARLAVFPAHGLVP